MKALLSLLVYQMVNASNGETCYCYLINCKIWQNYPILAHGQAKIPNNQIMPTRQLHQELQRIFSTRCEYIYISVGEILELVSIDATKVDFLLDQLVALGFVERKGQHLTLTETGRLATFDDCD